MKFSLAIASLFAASATAFVPNAGKQSTSALNSSWQPGGPPALGAPSGGFEMFSPDIPMKRIEGGGTVRTWDIPLETERLQYVLETNGRPLKAKVELYVQLNLRLPDDIPKAFERFIGDSRNKSSWVHR